jgi:hypothetical protein
MIRSNPPHKRPGVIVDDPSRSFIMMMVMI